MCHHFVYGLTRKNQQLVWQVHAPECIQNTVQLLSHSICRALVPVGALRGLASRQHIHKAPLLWTSKNNGGVVLCYVCVEGVGVELGQHIPGHANKQKSEELIWSIWS